MHDAVIVSAVRTPVGKAPKGALRFTRPDELAALVVREALARAGHVAGSDIDDVVMGCAMPEAEQGLNVARIASLRAGLPVTASAVTVNRFCASGLQAIAMAADRIRVGEARAVVAGGTESMSLVPMGGHKVAPNPALVERYPDVYLTTGLVAENHARQSGISREAQDAFALRSHERALAALDAGRFAGEIVPVTVQEVEPSVTGAPATRERVFAAPTKVRGAAPRQQALAALRPAFHVKGSVTAGNSSQTSDGAAALVLVSAGYARDHGLTPLARFVTYATAGVAPELFGLGPVPAVRKALAQAGLTLADIDLVEFNEAFAAQVLACQLDLGIADDRLNVNGGAIALGHPLGCTGARMTTSLVHEMRRRGVRYGLVTMCVGGGMGAAGIFEQIA